MDKQTREKESRLRMANIVWWALLITGILVGIRFARLLGLLVVILGILLFFAVKEGVFKKKP